MIGSVRSNTLFRTVTSWCYWPSHDSLWDPRVHPYINLEAITNSPDQARFQRLQLSHNCQYFFKSRRSQVSLSPSKSDHQKNIQLSILAQWDLGFISNLHSCLASMARLNRCRSDLCTLDHLYFSCNKERPKKASAFLLSLFCCDQKNLQTIVFTGGAKFRPTWAMPPPPPPIKFSAALHTCQVCMHCMLTDHINWRFIFHSVKHLDSGLLSFSSSRIRLPKEV